MMQQPQTPQATGLGAVAAGPQPAAPQQKQATPEEQAAYNKIYALSAVMLYTAPFTKKAEDMLRSAPDIVEGLAGVASAVGFRVYKQAADEGVPPEPIVLVSAGREFMNEVADYARLLGLEVSEDDEEMAYYRASDMFRDQMMAAGLLDEDTLMNEAIHAKGMVDPAEMDQMQQRMEARRAQPKLMGGAGA